MEKLKMNQIYMLVLGALRWSRMYCPMISFASIQISKTSKIGFVRSVIRVYPNLIAYSMTIREKSANSLRFAMKTNFSLIFNMKI